MDSFLDNFDLDELPTRENQTFEYKESRISFDEIQQKLPKAASAFWNSGGGAIFFGVDDDGKPDGGIPLKKGRLDIRDWLDSVIAKVDQNAKYEIRIYESSDAPGCNITCLLYTSPSPRDQRGSRMPSSA